MGNNKNDKQNVRKLTEAHNRGKGNVLAQRDAEYLRWVRLGANDQQLLGLRDELRAHRENAPVHDDNVKAHEQLQSEAFMLVRMLGTLMYQHLDKPEGAEAVEILRVDSKAAIDSAPDPKSVERIRRMGESDLNEIGGMQFQIVTTNDGNQWIFQLTSAANEGGEQE